MPKPSAKTAAARDAATALELMSLAGTLNAAVDLDFILAKAGETAEALLDSEASAIMLLSKDGKSLSFKVATGEKGKALETMTLAVGKGIAGWVAQTGEPRLVNDARSDEHFAAEFDKTSGFVTRSALCVPMLCRGRLIGVLEVLNRRAGAYDAADAELLGKLASFVAGTIDNARTLAEHKGYFANSLEVLTVAVEATMPGMSGHLNRAAKLARAIGRALELGEYDLKMLFYAGLLHDVGYVALNNPAYLAEMGVTKVSEELHPALSVKLVEGSAMFADALPLILAHHERWDGTGFPGGLKGESIPLGARILCLVEAVEELRMAGLRPPELYQEALAEAEAGSGKSFDPAVVAAFRGVVGARTTSW